jgi:hypothetical protein
LILQRIIARQTTGFCWNIRYELSGVTVTKTPKTQMLSLATPLQAMGAWLYERTKPALDAGKRRLQSS